MKKSLVAILASLSLLVFGGAAASAEVIEVVHQPLPGVPLDRCVQLQQTEQSDSVTFLCNWGPDQTGAGITKYVDKATPH